MLRFAAFRQSSGGPFGSPSVFEQNSNASSNLFSSNPFGGSNPFGSSTGGSVFGGSNPLGSSTGGSVFGGTSTGVFGVISLPGQFQQSTFGSLSPPAFGTSTAAFSAPSAPALGTSSSSSGG